MHNAMGNAITIRFALPSAELSPFVTTYYFSEVRTSAAEPWLEDYLHPEWPNLRFVGPGQCEAGIGEDPLSESPEFAVTGPTSRATRFRIRSGRSWGIGLLPLGWAKFIARPSGEYADRFVDGLQNPAFAVFQPLARKLAQSNGDFATELALIEEHMAGLANRSVRNEGNITAVNAALLDGDISSVSGLAERVDMNVRSLERLCGRVFGFPPKLLLRRQRFLRSLAQFMLDPSLKWLNALDFHYYDQAHFVRDFRRFMGMSPSAYAKIDKPLLIAAARARAAIVGQAVQGLHDPQQ